MIYRFEVVYIPQNWVGVNNLFRKLDLGIERVGSKETFEIKTSHTLNQTETMKTMLKSSLEAIGCEVIEIKGGVWE
jgi:hypothetical protein